MENPNSIFQTSYEDDLDEAQPRYHKPLKVATGETRIAPNTQGNIIDPQSKGDKKSEAFKESLSRVSYLNASQPMLPQLSGTHTATPTQPPLIARRPPVTIPASGRHSLLRRCGHYHTVIEEALCLLHLVPLDHCKFHANIASCRYYCRKLNIGE